MALTTSNSPVVSVPQIEHADVVVTATIPDPNGDLALVERNWKGELPLEKIRVLNLHEGPDLQRDKKYILALSRFGRDYRITRPEGQVVNAPPIVYPATHEIIDQLRPALKERAAR